MILSVWKDTKKARPRQRRTSHNYLYYNYLVYPPPNRFPRRETKGMAEENSSPKTKYSPFESIISVVNLRKDIQNYLQKQEITCQSAKPRQNFLSPTDKVTSPLDPSRERIII